MARLAALALALAALGLLAPLAAALTYYPYNTNPGLAPFPGCPAWSKPASAVSEYESQSCGNVVIQPGGNVTVNGVQVDCWCVVYGEDDGGAIGPPGCKVNGLVPITMGGSCSNFTRPDPGFVCASEAPVPRNEVVYNNATFDTAYMCDTSSYGIKVQFSAQAQGDDEFQVGLFDDDLSVIFRVSAVGDECVHYDAYVPGGLYFVVVGCNSPQCNLKITGNFTPICRTDFVTRTTPWNFGACVDSSEVMERVVECLVLDGGMYVPVDPELCRSARHGWDMETTWNCSDVTVWTPANFSCTGAISRNGTCFEGPGYNCSWLFGGHTQDPVNCFEAYPGPANLNPCDACNYEYTTQIQDCIETHTCVNNAGAPVDDSFCGSAPPINTTSCSSSDNGDNSVPLFVSVVGGVAACVLVAATITFIFTRRRRTQARSPGDVYVDMSQGQA